MRINSATSDLHLRNKQTNKSKHEDLSGISIDTQKMEGENSNLEFKKNFNLI